MAMDIALFFHFLGVAVLFVSIGLTEVSGARARRSTTVADVRTWIGLGELAGRLFGPAFVLILGAGIYMAADTWGFDRPFVIVGIVSVVLMIALGGGIVGRAFAAVGRQFESGEAKAEDIPSLVTRRPVLWATSTALDTMAIGLIWVMVSKPDWGESIGVVAVFAVLGALVGAQSARRGSKAAN